MEQNNLRPLSGRSAIITGGSRGLGLAIAKEFVLNGANVFIVSRDAAQLKKSEFLLSEMASSSQKVSSAVIDISNEDHVQTLCSMVISEFGGVEILVNNAGVYGSMGKFDECDWNEYKDGIQINLFGSLNVIRSFIPHFRKLKYGKIIQLSGGGATQPLPNLSNYALSKAAIVRFCETISIELKSENIDVNCIAPGALNTTMLDQVIDAGPSKVGVDFYEKALKQKSSGGTDVRLGAELAVYLASSQSDGLTGKLISAVWDNWREWGERALELNNSDIFCLRRVAGKDVGISWADV